ncbi:rho guanine nucleotide exchange factor 10-like protein [Macrobrachium rosenbergii]|uniref:rho guanine nucleotide exchange factor 10-like protein n=1 Tax=Macrobrachium rosenbergii TaxID=79674 RepID=UPI0034D4BDA3
MSFPYQKKPRQNLSLDLSQPILIKPAKRTGLKHTNSVCLPLTKSGQPGGGVTVTPRLSFSNHKSSSQPVINTSTSNSTSCLLTQLPPANDNAVTSDVPMTSQQLPARTMTSMEVASRISSSSESEEDGEGWLLLNERSKPWPEPDQSEDTRAHVVGELYDTERNYVNNLNFLLTRYQQTLKSPEYSAIIDASLVDDIFFQVPEIHGHHERFMEEMRQRLESRDASICVGDIFLQMVNDPGVVESYTAFTNNWKTAQEAAKAAAQAKPAFKHFLVARAREHPGKLDLKALRWFLCGTYLPIICGKPVQREIPQL